MFRLVYFAILAIVLGSLATGLATSQAPLFFKYGVAFIGYSVGAALVVMGVVTRNDD